MFKSIKKFCGKQTETPLWVLLFLFVAIVVMTVLNVITIVNTNSTEDNYQAAIATHQETIRSQQEAIAELGGDPVPEDTSHEVSETEEAPESLDETPKMEGSEREQANNIFDQAFTSWRPPQDLDGRLLELWHCVDDHQKCGWAPGERDSVLENMHSIDSAAYLQEIISNREQVWDLREEAAMVQERAGAITLDETDAGHKAKFARLKEQGGDLISLPYEAILDRAEAVIEQAQELGFEEGRLVGMIGLVETTRIEITELIRRLDNLH